MLRRRHRAASKVSRSIATALLFSNALSLCDAYGEVKTLDGKKPVGSDCNQTYLVERYASETFPAFDTTKMEIEIVNDGSAWRATYEYPLDMSAEPRKSSDFPILVIDKATCKIVSAEHR